MNSKIKLNLPNFNFKIKIEKEKEYIYDIFRKKYYLLTPEEWVRQNLLLHLVENFNYPIGRIAIEKKLNVLDNYKRFDAVVYDKMMKPLMLAECKEHNIEIEQSVFNQIGSYNYELKAPFLLVSNGINHFVAEVDFEKRKIDFLKQIPDYNDIK
jgi:hypothetical protein